MELLAFISQREGDVGERGRNSEWLAAMTRSPHAAGRLIEAVIARFVGGIALSLARRGSPIQARTNDSERIEPKHLCCGVRRAGNSREQPLQHDDVDERDPDQCSQDCSSHSRSNHMVLIGHRRSALACCCLRTVGNSALHSHSISYMPLHEAASKAACARHNHRQGSNNSRFQAFPISFGAFPISIV